MTENTESKQVGWTKGQSGNPAGRPKGAKNKTTLAAEAMLESQAKAITQKVVELALGGDLIALKMCMDRLLPVPRRPLVEQNNTLIQQDKNYVVVVPHDLNMSDADWQAKFGYKPMDDTEVIWRPQERARIG